MDLGNTVQTSNIEIYTKKNCSYTAISIGALYPNITNYGTWNHGYLNRTATASTCVS